MRMAWVLCLLMVAAPAAGQSSLDRIGRQLSEVVAASALQGYELDGQALTSYSVAGMLGPGGSVALVIDLWAGRSYRITGVCDRSCANLDLSLHDTDQPALAIAEDSLGDKVPMLEFTVRRTGPHLLAVDMAGCSEARCHFGISVLSQQAGPPSR